MPGAAVASLTAALQQFESVSAEARAAADGAIDRQIESARARLSSDGAASGTETASAAEPRSAAEHSTEASSRDVQQELLEQRQSMDAVLGRLIILLILLGATVVSLCCPLHGTQISQDSEPWH